MDLHKDVDFDQLEEVAKYREINNLNLCISDKDNCICRVYYLKFPLCKFGNIYAYFSLMDKDKADDLLNSICFEVRNDWNNILKEKKKI